MYILYDESFYKIISTQLTILVLIKDFFGLYIWFKSEKSNILYGKNLFKLYGS